MIKHYEIAPIKISHTHTHTYRMYVFKVSDRHFTSKLLRLIMVGMTQHRKKVWVLMRYLQATSPQCTGLSRRRRCTVTPEMFWAGHFTSSLHAGRYLRGAVDCASKSDVLFAGLGCSGPVFCLLLRVSSGCAQPITGQVTSVTWPAIGWAKSELTSSKRQKTGPDAGKDMAIRMRGECWYCMHIFSMGLLPDT